MPSLREEIAALQYDRTESTSDVTGSAAFYALKANVLAIVDKYRDWGWQGDGYLAGCPKVDPVDSQHDKAEPKGHIRHIAKCLRELYATMVDPVEDGPKNVREMCEVLLATAREQREKMAQTRLSSPAISTVDELLHGLDAKPGTREERPSLAEMIHELEKIPDGWDHTRNRSIENILRAIAERLTDAKR